MSYMMKLGWDLMIKMDSLWVIIVRVKDDYGNLSITFIHCGSKALHICQSIAINWKLVENGISRVIHNGHYVRF